MRASIESSSPRSALRPGAADPAAQARAPLVSIIVDNYNYAPFLERSIDSALAQTYERVEVIVVDDASTDDSPAIIARYADRATAILMGVNRGQAGASTPAFA